MHVTGPRWSKVEEKSGFNYLSGFSHVFAGMAPLDISSELELKLELDNNKLTHAFLMKYF